MTGKKPLSPPQSLVEKSSQRRAKEVGRYLAKLLRREKPVINVSRSKDFEAANSPNLHNMMNSSVVLSVPQQFSNGTHINLYCGPMIDGSPSHPKDENHSETIRTMQQYHYFC